MIKLHPQSMNTNYIDTTCYSGSKSYSYIHLKSTSFNLYNSYSKGRTVAL